MPCLTQPVPSALEGPSGSAAGQSKGVLEFLAIPGISVSGSPWLVVSLQSEPEIQPCGATVAWVGDDALVHCMVFCFPKIMFCKRIQVKRTKQGCAEAPCQPGTDGTFLWITGMEGAPQWWPCCGPGIGGLKEQG